MKIKYELNSTHVCHDNVCFKIPSVLVKNMTDKVILGLPFINTLYHFLVEHDGITTNPFGQKVKFKFASKSEIDIIICLMKYIYIYIYVWIHTYIIHICMYVWMYVELTL